ncbi:class I SAM-dependent methyltransferase [Aquamicrobium sp. LC103]|uniref:class I SAM-dependent methyltransferase n=1 Tax=Aquamicrobium sp. LC103 TaxID=1120658 RepID=UPI00063EA34F|nr:class I SAM-dependent methyltransferase [Aquamicrobium sp. LC103]TKT82856.1 class I SAM-dependent methyltransferase [Aquamicrobium sp. LC103]
MAAQIEHGRLMDRVYRHQRHFYDATRKYYLIGRDPMIEGLAPPVGGTVLEIGCGTGRNLVKAAALYPDASFFGIDISAEMLATAGKAVVAAGEERRIRLALADAAGFEPQKVFGRQAFDRVFISYAVSMIPAWRQVMEKAVEILEPGGSLHIVDFGDLDHLPPWSRAALYKWLEWYHVTPRGTLFETSAELAESHGCVVEERRLYRGFAWISVIRRQAAGLRQAA